jgi:hypothetical protein
VTVFLRWGVFGILAVAALVYAYNASKDLASRRAATPATAPTARAEPPSMQPGTDLVTSPVTDTVGQPVATPAADTPQTNAPPDAACELEIVVAQRAIEARDAREPLDRLLRMREIAFEEDAARRERLTRVATRWFEHAGPIGPYSVRREAAAECVAATPR